MTARRVVVGAVALATAVTACSASPASGDRGQVLDFATATCAEWKAATDPTKLLNAEALLYEIRRAAGILPPEPGADLVTNMAADVDTRCRIERVESLLGTVMSGVVRQRLAFYTG